MANVLNSKAYTSEHSDVLKKTVWFKKRTTGGSHHRHNWRKKEHDDEKNRPVSLRFDEEKEELVDSRVDILTPFVADLCKPSRPRFEYSDLVRGKYVSRAGIVNLNCHLGQRKLLETEIEFYAKVAAKGKPALVIYAGSASCEHLPVILEMFPLLKFILVDPNYHLIDSDLQYVYQNIPVIAKNNWTLFKSQLRKGTKGRHAHNRKNTLQMLTTKFWDGSVNDVIETTRKFFWEGGLENPTVAQMMSKMKDFDENHTSLVEDVMKSDTSVYIIQDYMTLDLTRKLKASVESYRAKVGETPMYFLTDIRTVEFLSEPHDLDILWNSALQVIYLKVLEPDYSMLKFRPPFFADLKSSETKWFTKFCAGNGDVPPGKEFIAGVMRDDLAFVKEQYQIDLLGNYLNGDFWYFDGTVLTQPWAPRTSSETRLFVSFKNLTDPPIRYDNFEWEDKFMWFRFHRTFSYNPIFYEILGPMWDYDGCHDCMREIMILGEYMLGVPTIETNLDAIAELLKKKKYRTKLEQLYRLINKYTFFDLSRKNFKCPWHGTIRQTPVAIKPILTDSKLLKQYSLTPDKPPVLIHSEGAVGFTDRDVSKICCALIHGDTN
jgi:hypothetical protein